MEQTVKYNSVTIEVKIVPDLVAHRDVMAIRTTKTKEQMQRVKGYSWRPSLLFSKVYF